MRRQQLTEAQIGLHPAPLASIQLRVGYRLIRIYPGKILKGAKPVETNRGLPGSYRRILVIA
jgi:hypothetical protein